MKHASWTEWRLREALPLSKIPLITAAIIPLLLNRANAMDLKAVLRLWCSAMRAALNAGIK